MTGYNVSRYARPELLATAEWLAENLGRPGFGVLDLRWRPDGSGHRLYAMGHIPGATYIDWRTDLVEQEDESEALLLAGPTRVAETLARVGIGNGMVAVIYDDTAGSYAARAWWTMRVYGFDSARILVGGLEAWRNLGQPISTTAELRPPTTFTPRLAGRTRLTASDLRQLLGSPQVQLLDARAPSEFAGHAGSTRQLGHIPGALNVPASAMTEPLTGRFRDAEELRSQLRRAGVDTRRRIVCYDSVGLGACKLAFALTLLGCDDVAVYDGGWVEWGDRLDLPVER
ncbi:MAG TPA: sulfurtransferase [Candidatus Limnocylindrales bacterium]|jgi:Rhodanese-related sulfurtransferase|nr:sulfurtransferase [Candidatus Limnocylindrales bacterium]